MQYKNLRENTSFCRSKLEGKTKLANSLRNIIMFNEPKKKKEFCFASMVKNLHFQEMEEN